MPALLLCLSAAGLGLTAEQVERVYRDVDNKRSTTRYLHLPAQLIDTVPEIHLG